MVDFYNEKERLALLKESVLTSKDALKCDELKKELAVIKEKQGIDGYWLDVESSTADNRKISEIEKNLHRIEEAEAQIKYIEELIEISEEMDDSDSQAEVVEKLGECEKSSEALFLETLLKGKYDTLNAILTIHAGAGGTEAQDWAEMLYRMYTRYAERAGYEFKLLDLQAGDGAGIKSVTFMLSGENAYGFLKAEKGVHRLVRISPFDANKRRHTSFASLEVMPEIIYDDEIKIAPDELRVDTLRSGGAGGQHVNKTESAVRLTHLPSGIVVLCQNERSQIQNREIAMRLLLSKLAEKREREQQEAASSIKGELKKIEWGSQIRSYVFCPYTLVKDHRTGFENTDVNKVMDGDIEGFIYEYLKRA